MRKRIPAAAAVLAALPVVSVHGQQPELLTLDRAIELALEHNRPLRIAALEIRKSEDRIASARTNRLPKLSWYALGAQRLTALNFRFDQGSLGVYPGIGPVPGRDTNIRAPARPSALLIGRIDQPLSQQYRIGLGLRQLGFARSIAQEQQRSERQNVVAEVKRVYYGILQAQSALESIEETIRLLREVDRVTEQYVVQQAALKSDALEVKLRLAKAEYEALAVRNPLASQKEQLNRLLGRDVAAEFRVGPVEEAAWMETDLAAARRLALERRPEIAERRLKLKQAETDRRMKKAEYIPEVSANFTYLSPLNYGSLVPANIAMAGVAISWEPFDWGRKKRELAEKSSTVEQAELAVREAEALVSIDVNARHRRLQETRQLLAIARLAQEAARENLRVGKNRYAQEVAMLKDVLQLQAAVAEAGSQYQKALLAFWTARAEFEKAIGEEQPAAGGAAAGGNLR